MSIQTVNPNTNTVVKSFDEINDQALESSVAQAEIAYTLWSKTSFFTLAQIW